MSFYSTLSFSKYEIVKYLSLKSFYNLLVLNKEYKSLLDQDQIYLILYQIRYPIFSKVHSLFYPSSLENSKSHLRIYCTLEVPTTLLEYQQEATSLAKKLIEYDPELEEEEKKKGEDSYRSCLNHAIESMKYIDYGIEQNKYNISCSLTIITNLLNLLLVQINKNYISISSSYLADKIEALLELYNNLSVQYNKTDHNYYSLISSYAAIQNHTKVRELLKYICEEEDVQTMKDILYLLRNYYSKEAIEIGKKIIELTQQEEEQEEKDLIGGIYNVIGCCYYDMQLYKLSLENLLIAISYNSTNRVFYYNIALTYENLGKYSSSIHHYNLSIQYSKEDPHFLIKNYKKLVEIYGNKTNQLVESIECLEKLIELGPKNNMDYYLEILYSYHTLKNLEKLEYYLDLIESKNSFLTNYYLVEYYLYKTVLYYEKKLYQKTFEIFEYILCNLKMNLDQSCSFYRRKALLYEATGEFEKAVQDYETSLTFKNHPGTYFYLSRFYASKEKISSSYYDLNKANFYFNQYKESQKEYNLFFYKTKEKELEDLLFT